ncbi:MAG: hypothetical protein KDD52_05170 [Bdellovibrionales bacterium]|nr:hypothetical protein [Bdellovibrionales bacterium]
MSELNLTVKRTSSVLCALEVLSFRSKWYKLKSSIDHNDVRLHKLLSTVSCSIRDVGHLRKLNPRFMDYWFPPGKCHENSLFACWILNKKSLSGPHRIINSEQHSAVLDCENGYIYDPTLESLGLLTDTKQMLRTELIEVNVLQQAYWLDILKPFVELVGQEHVSAFLKGDELLTHCQQCGIVPINSKEYDDLKSERRSLQ